MALRSEDTGRGCAVSGVAGRPQQHVIVTGSLLLWRASDSPCDARGPGDGVSRYVPGERGHRFRQWKHKGKAVETQGKGSGNTRTGSGS